MKISKSFLFIIILVLSIALAACGGSGDDGESNSGSNGASQEETAVTAGDADVGKEQYNKLCIACHGEGGIGMEGLGKDMTISEYIREANDEELLAFIKVGRPIGDPENTTNVDMPPKGGNPALTDEQILDIIAYIRTIQQ